MTNILDAIVITNARNVRTTRRAFSHLGKVKVVPWCGALLGHRARCIITINRHTDIERENKNRDDYIEQIRCRLFEPPHDQIYHL